MSFITRCPACHTAFKVVSDQLKISEGWVRCGHCQQIFDATLDLQPWWPGVESVSPPPPQPPSSVEPEAALESPDPVPAPEREELPAAQAPEPALEPQPERAPEPEPDFGPIPEPIRAPEPQAEAPFSADEPPPEPPPMPSFVRQAERRAVWRRPGVRWTLAAMLVLLLGGLGVQAALHWRDPIAAHVPQTQPALATLCAPLDCAVAPPRQLDDIVIDSSVLLRRAPGQYTFNVVVRNTAAVALAAPALELTLTDLQDQVVVRRVLLSHEWPEPRETIAAGAEWPVQFELELDAPQAQVMTGYRALLFYP